MGESGGLTGVRVENGGRGGGKGRRSGGKEVGDGEREEDRKVENGKEDEGWSGGEWGRMARMVWVGWNRGK